MLRAHLRQIVWVVSVGVIALLSSAAQGQCERSWVTGPNGIREGRVLAMVSWDPDGGGPQPAVLVVGGQFTTAADTPVSNVAAWDGSSWHPLGVGLNGTVRALAVFNSELYAGGEFTASGTTPVHYLAKWTGASWQEVIFGTDGFVNALVPNGGELVVGGEFTHVAGTFFPFPYLARYSPGSWSGYLNPPSGPVTSVVISLGDPLVIVQVDDGFSGHMYTHKLEKFSNGAFVEKNRMRDAGPMGMAGNNVFYSSQNYLGAQCSTSNDIEYAIYRFIDGTGSGSNWSSLNHTAHSFVTFNGSLYAVGRYSRECPQTYTQRGWVGVWNGSVWADVPTDIVTPEASCVTVHSGSMYLGGLFNVAGPGYADRVVRLNGLAWEPLVPGFNAIARCATYLNGSPFVGGDFTHAGSLPASYASTYTGTAWVGVGNLDGPVTGIGTYASNPQQIASVVMTGSFTHSATSAVGHIVAHNPVAQTYTALGSGLDAGGRAILQVNTSFNHADLVVGGDFMFAGGVAAPHIARWNGAAWITSPFGIGMNDSVLALANYNGQIVAGGQFTLAGGASHPYIAQWNGSAWQSMGAGLNGPVRALATANNLLYAGGDFTLAGGVGVAHVATWNGTAWNPVGPGLDGIVYALNASGTNVLAGGTFLHAGATPVNHIAQWDGSAWSHVGVDPRSAGGGTDDAVLGIASGSGDIVAAGAFTHAGGLGNLFVARAPTVGGSPEFYQQPASANVCTGGNATLTARFYSGTGSVGSTLAWYANGNHLLDGTSAHGTTYSHSTEDTLVLSHISTADSGVYWCVATTGCGEVVTSASATLSVGGAGCCRADFNNDGVLSVQDIFDFLNAWFAGDIRADFDGAGGLQVQDIFDFLNAWFVGC